MIFVNVGGAEKYSLTLAVALCQMKLNRLTSVSGCGTVSNRFSHDLFITASWAHHTYQSYDITSHHILSYHIVVL